MILPDGTKIKIPHRGKPTVGTVVRYDNGKPHYSPFYVIDVGEYASVKFPAHRVSEFGHSPGALEGCTAHLSSTQRP